MNIQIPSAVLSGPLCWQAERDNKSVYFQHVPAADSLAAIQPRRLVTATTYTLPAPAALVNDALMESFTEVPPDKVSGRGPSCRFSLLVQKSWCRAWARSTIPHALLMRPTWHDASHNIALQDLRISVLVQVCPIASSCVQQ